MLFDSHAHVNTVDTARYPVDPVDGRLSPNVFSAALPAEALVAAMDATGVARAVIVQRCHVYGFDNSYILDSADAFPDRLKALCVIDGRAGSAEAQARACLARGAAGIRYMEPVKGEGLDWLASDHARAGWRATVAAGGSMRIHLHRWNRIDGLAVIGEMLAEVPETRLVIDHLTNIDPSQPGHGIDDGLKRLAEHPNVALLFSMINLRRWADEGIDTPPVLEAVVRLFGADRILWGSDVGNTSGDYGAMIARAKAAAANLSEPDCTAIFGGTAQRIYGW